MFPLTKGLPWDLYAIILFDEGQCSQTAQQKSSPYCATSEARNADTIKRCWDSQGGKWTIFKFIVLSLKGYMMIHLIKFLASTLINGQHIHLARKKCRSTKTVVKVKEASWRSNYINITIISKLPCKQILDMPFQVAITLVIFSLLIALRVRYKWICYSKGIVLLDSGVGTAIPLFA